MVIKRNIINSIANKEMDRGEFLKYTGLFILGLIGFGAIFNAASNVGLIDDKHSGKVSGFGNGKYGA